MRPPSTFAASLAAACLLLLSLAACSGSPDESAPAESTPAAEAQSATITDMAGREHALPAQVTRVICSGPGCMRLLTYLGCQDRAVAADDIESRRRAIDARPYALAHPELRELPIFGEFRGHDNPELIVALDPQPQVIFKTFNGMGYDPAELEAKTGIPVVVLDYGDFGQGRDRFYASLRLMAQILGVSERAEAIIAYLDANIAELDRRTEDIPEADRPTCYVGGIAHRGPHGFQSTEPNYPPLLFVNARHAAMGMGGGGVDHADVAKEQIVAWNPQVLFVDLSTLQLDGEANALGQIRTDPAYQHLTAVQEGEAFGVLPYNWYTLNYGSVLADAWFVGKTLYPDHFADVDPAAKADEIYTFLVGAPVFEAMNQSFGDLVFTRLDVSPEAAGETGASQ